MSSFRLLLNKDKKLKNHIYYSWLSEYSFEEWFSNNNNQAGVDGLLEGHGS